jgi:hypothetical protein
MGACISKQKHAEVVEHLDWIIEENKAQITRREEEIAKLRSQIEAERKNIVTLRDDKGTADSKVDQINTELEKIQAKRIAAETLVEQQKIAFKEFADASVLQWGYIAVEAEIVILEIYNGETDEFMGEQILMAREGHQELSLLPTVVGGRLDKKKPKIRDIDKELKSEYKHTLKATAEHTDQVGGRKKYSVLSVFELKKAAKSKKKLESITVRLYHRKGRDNKGDEEWSLISEQHSIIIPGENLDDPDELEWVAEFSEGLETSLSRWMWSPRRTVRSDWRPSRRQRLHSQRSALSSPRNSRIFSKLTRKPWKCMRRNRRHCANSTRRQDSASLQWNRNWWAEPPGNGRLWRNKPKRTALCKSSYRVWTHFHWRTCDDSSS